MMKIRMKVKNIIWSILGIVLLIVVIIPSINLIFAYNLRDSRPEVAEKLFEINTKYPSSFMKDESLYNLSNSLMNDYNRNNMYMGASSWGRSPNYSEIIPAKENYEKIISDYPKSEFYASAYQGILDAYIFLGDVRNLEKWINWGKENDREDIKEISIIYDSYVHFANRQYPEAEDILNISLNLEDNELKLLYYSLKGSIEFMKEDFDKAMEYYEEINDFYRGYGSYVFANSLRIDGEFLLKRLTFKGDKNKIKGRVMVEDKGIPFVPIFLKYPNEGYSTRGGDFVGITDKDGYFETIGVKDGEYEIGIGIGSHFIDDKVYLTRAEYSLDLASDIEFNFDFTSPMKLIKPGPKEIVKDSKFTVEWEEIEGADYYTIDTILFSDSYNSSSRFVVDYEENQSKIKDNKVTLDLEVLKDQRGVQTWLDNNTSINPEAVLGYFYPGSERPIIVNAYDKEGNKLNSSISTSIYHENLPSVKIEYGELTEGERIILDMDYERAIKYYEDRLIKNKKDEEALRYLAKIHMVDWEWGKSDYDKSIYYSKGYYELTGDKTLLNRAVETKEVLGK